MKLHLCRLQSWLIYCQTYQSVDMLIQVPPEILDSLQWWVEQSNVCQGVPFAHSLPAKTAITNASSVGWGAHIGTLKVQGLWSEQEASFHIGALTHLQCMSCLLGSDQESSGSHAYWHHHWNVLCEQAGRSPLWPALSENNKVLPLLQQRGWDLHSSTLTGLSKSVVQPS